jgi:hypothetical protein
MCALEAIFGLSRTLYNYAMLMLLPGMIVLAVTQPYVHDLFSLSPRGRILGCAWLTLICTLFWLVRPWWLSTHVAISGFAIVFLVATVTVAAAIQLRQRWRARV